MYDILLIEDDSAIYFILGKYKFWENSKFRITKRAANGKEGLEILKTQSFDLIITDIRMPCIDGLEFLKILREKGDMTEVILASTYADFEYAREGLRLGALDYIEKPFTEEKLVEALERAGKVLEEEALAEQNNTGIWLADYIEEDKQDSFVKQVLSFMAEHITDDYMLEQLAEQMNLTKDYIGKLFRTKTERTLGDCYTQMKIEYAKEMLRTTNMKIYEISDRLGYSTVDYFSKVFKKYTAQTPAQYRKTERNT